MDKMIFMDEKKKEWIKKNWIYIALDCLPLCIWIIIVFTLYDFISILYFKDNLLLSIYAEILTLGTLIFMTLGMIYIEIWGKKVIKYREDYDKHMEK